MINRLPFFHGNMKQRLSSFFNIFWLSSCAIPLQSRIIIGKLHAIIKVYLLIGSSLITESLNTLNFPFQMLIIRLINFICLNKGYKSGIAIRLKLIMNSWWRWSLIYIITWRGINVNNNIIRLGVLI